MSVTIDADDPRTIRALEIAANAGQWLACRDRAGRHAYGIPSQLETGRYYLVTASSCDCADFRRRTLAGRNGEQLACKHVLAVRLHGELVRALHAPPPPAGPTTRRRRGHLSLVSDNTRDASRSTG
ncbi:MAG TPA: hypothetical protein VF937_14335 [Chloroflexota bacterium]